MNFDYVSLRRLERFFTDLKAWLASKYATKDVATTSADGLMSSADKLKLNGLETGAEVNTIESISANGTALLPDANKNVNLPLATDEADGLIPRAEFRRIPGIPDPQDGADQVFSYDSDHSTGWQSITKEYVGNVLLDENTGKPIIAEEDETPIYDEGSAELWTAYKGTEFCAARAYADQDGNNIKATYATKEDLNAALGDIESLLAAL